MPDRPERVTRYIQPCPENGITHDCANEYIMWMPVETFDDIIRQAVEAARETPEQALDRLRPVQDPCGTSISEIG